MRGCRGDTRPWTPPAGCFVYCGTFSASVPVMKPQKVAEMDFSHTHTLPPAADGARLCWRCVSGLGPSPPPSRGAPQQKITKERGELALLRPAASNCASPGLVCHVWFCFFPPVRRLTAASAIPGFGFWFLLLHMWSLTAIHPGPLCTSTQRQTTKHRWSHRTHNSRQRPGWFVMGRVRHNSSAARKMRKLLRQRWENIHTAIKKASSKDGRGIIDKQTPPYCPLNVFLMTNRIKVGKTNRNDSPS